MIRIGLTFSNSVFGKRKVLIISDHPVLREGLALLINREPDLEACGEFGDGPGMVRAAPSLEMDIIVVDLSPDAGKGTEIIREIGSRASHVPVLVLSSHEEAIYVEHTFRAGAKGYVLKRETTSRVIDAIRQVLKGGTYLSEGVSAPLLERFVGLLSGTGRSSREQVLSSRECLVLQLIGEGVTTRQIAERLCISIKTVETYRSRIKRKLSIKNHPDLLQYAICWAGGFRC